MFRWETSLIVCNSKSVKQSMNSKSASDVANKAVKRMCLHKHLQRDFLCQPNSSENLMVMKWSEMAQQPMWNSAGQSQQSVITCFSSAFTHPGSCVTEWLDAVPKLQRCTIRVTTGQRSRSNRSAQVRKLDLKLKSETIHLGRGLFTLQDKFVTLQGGRRLNLKGNQWILMTTRIQEPSWMWLRVNDWATLAPSQPHIDVYL